MMYNPAFDPFNGIYRMLNILRHFGVGEIIEVDRLRIYDFYLLFPYKTYKIRFKRTEVFYALGGDYTHFVPEVRNCAKVMVEVAIGKAVITLSRPIEKDKEGRILGQRGMTIYWGSMDEVLADTCEWNTFGYKTMPTRCSFSNELFEVMDMPIVQGDNNITMYQLLRLLYIDQESPTSSLFLYDPFDKQTNREMVADLLMGIFDSDLYAAKLRQKELEVAIVDAKASLRSLESSLSPEMRSVEHISQLIEYKNQEIGKISEDITKKRQGEEIKEQKRTETDRQKAEVRRLNHECAAVEDEFDMLEHEIEDSTMFISELERKKLALNHSVNTREILGSLRLEYCPECLSPLPEDVPDGTCRLCKSPIENKTGIAQEKRLISELTFQIKESELILRNDEEKRCVSSQSCVAYTPNTRRHGKCLTRCWEMYAAAWQR